MAKKNNKNFFPNDRYYGREINRVMHPADGRKTYVNLCTSEHDAEAHTLILEMLAGKEDAHRACSQLIEGAMPLVGSYIVEHFRGADIKHMSIDELYSSGCYGLFCALSALQKPLKKSYEQFAYEAIRRGIENDMELFSKRVSMSHYGYAKKETYADTYNHADDDNRVVREVDARYQEPLPDEEYCRKERHDRLQEIFRRVLTPMEVSIILEHIENDRSCLAIAVKYQLRYANVRSHYAHAVRKLRDFPELKALL